MPPLTRGPLPARVYWTRRLVVLATALLLVLGVARLLGAGSDASSGPDQAARLASEGSTAGSASVSPQAVGTVGPRKPAKARSSKVPVLAEPDGPCADEDIAVTPEVPRAVGGPNGGVFVVLHLRTIEAEACTWRVSPDTLTLKITSGKDDIWASRHCPRAVPTRDVVVRRAVSTTIGVQWNARRSDEDCSRHTLWALPGYYHLAVAALAGEPSDIQFELEAPTGPVVTRSPSPTAKPKGGRASGRPVTSPSGATEPNG